MYKKIEFLKSVFDTKDLPKNNLPEVVLCGRSNVGKSSFINSFFNKKYLAKISSAPGKTRSLNYYNVEDLFYLVDLPGYGYAKVSKEERNKWSALVQSYFSSGREIKLAIHFIDSRNKPTQLDFDLNNYLKKLLIPYTVILSKIDKLKQSELAFAKKEISSYFPELFLGENLLFYSSIKGTGKKEVQKKFSILFQKSDSLLI
ncbi:MAG: ribosome biogenesis GTP-binding protein YihA/YsxC [Ignavibacteriales bacterium]|nr:ribosome biogenesis GTP-binding protein YihA/YsxC [Ignavibacteriales bacterium]